jgi:AcrR family transcriptional regulator
MSTSTRDRIVRAMGDLMCAQGYSATSVKQVAIAAAAPMGSLYHHFPNGKQEIAAEALRTTGAAYIQLLPLLMDPYSDLRTAVGAFFTAAAEDIERAGWANMCPIGTVVGELTDNEADLRSVAAEVVGSWISQGTEYFLRYGLAETTARRLVLAILGALEGAFLLSRTLHSTEPLHAAGKAMATHAEALLTRTETAADR